MHGRGETMRALLVMLSLAVCAGAAEAECVDVKYYTAQCLDLALLDCTDTESSFVHQVCYDTKKRFMVILLRNTRYPYCSIPPETVDALIKAGSVGRYYNENVKGRFDCRVNPVPSYPMCTC
jgi:KTSC domain